MIAQAKDTRDTLGRFASKVENRSLLFEKMALAKTWGHDSKFVDATRFNVIRAATGGRGLLHQSVEESEGIIRGRNTQEHVREQHEYRKNVAIELAQLKGDDSSLIELRINSGLTLVNLLEQSYPNRHRTFIGELGGRLLINMAGGVQENAGLSLDRCFGLPLIPGSAAKGVSRHHALWEIRSCQDQLKRRQLLRSALLIFGFVGQDLEARKDRTNQTVTNWAWAVEDSPEILRDLLSELNLASDFKGLISFLPASPASSKNLRIVAEGITPHTEQKDNLRDNRRAGSEASRLVPLAFPAVERGSQFAFSLVLNRQFKALPEQAHIDLLQQAELWLKSAVTGTGIGAKTSAGFGWFIIDEEAAEKRRAEAEALAQAEEEKIKQQLKTKAEEEAKSKEAARITNLEDSIAMHATIYAKLDNKGFSDLSKKVGSNEVAEEEARAFFRELATPARKDRLERWKKDERWPALEAAASKLNIELT